MKAVVAAFNQEKALVGAFSVIVQPVVEQMDRFAALSMTLHHHTTAPCNPLAAAAQLRPLQFMIHGDTAATAGLQRLERACCQYYRQ